MHFLIGLGLLAGLLYFVFGERVARVFVGTALTVAACFVLMLVGIAALDITRQVQQPRTVKRMNAAPATVVQVSPQDLALIWERIDARDVRR